MWPVPAQWGCYESPVTGLGNTEMACQIDGLHIKDGHLLMTVKAIEPVRWRIRIVLTYNDILRLLRVGTFVILTYLVVSG